MKAVQILLLAVVVACASAFTTGSSRLAFKPLAMSKEQTPVTEMKNNNAAALAAFASAMAPLIAHAEEGDAPLAAVSTVATAVDEATVIGYGAGLVACVVSLAVGFAIGYGTLVKP